MNRREKSKHQKKIDQFCAAENLADIARLLSFTPRDLGYILYKLDGGRENQYVSFSVPKKSGGTRTISAPKTALKEVQSRLNKLLQMVYWERPSVHSFLEDRSIVSNALKHTRKRFIFNVDLKDFFPSIHFGRVRGLFMAGPYNLNKDAATVIAQIACYSGSLPQGSPCSPIISNMICSMLDKELQNLAKKERCLYTRYADDITFSTNLKEFPRTVGYRGKTGVFVGRELKKIVTSNGFTINRDKTNLQTPEMRQEVTGLIVNKFVNVRRKTTRQVHAMLHAWEKFGLKAAEKEHKVKYLSISEDVEKPSFRNVVRGKIEFIRMVRDNIPKRYKKKNEDVSIRLLTKYFECLLREGENPIIRTEGHTDWMHLCAAWDYLKTKKKYSALEIDFFRVKEHKCFGNAQLLKFCKNVTKLKPFSKKIICVFDSDDKEAKKEHKKTGVKEWGNNTFSFMLPNSPVFTTEDVSIEMFYGRKTIKAKDKNGRRLFLSDEFLPNGNHKILKNVSYGYNPAKKDKIKGWKEHLKGAPKILDSNVFKKVGDKHHSMALSKSTFARYVLYKEPSFDNVKFDNFERIFNIILKIAK